MIPALVKITGAPHLVLPPGIHPTSLPELEGRFAFTDHRKKLFGGLQAVVSALRYAGCSAIYVDGSFVTDKAVPADYDGCWDPAGVDITKLDPVLLDYDNGRAEQKKKYLGEMFIATLPEISGKTFLEFFQIERNTGAAKGIALLKS